MSSNGKNIPKRLVLTVLGIGFLVLGVALILVWWHDVVSLFRGTSGMALALAGLLMLYSLKET